MMVRIFSEAEDRRFSDLVLRYNTLEEGSEERLALEGVIQERTKILLYMIPHRNLYLSKEDSSAFFMHILYDIDRIIGEFRASGLTYNGYLTQICRFRCKGFMKQRNSQEVVERALLYSDVTAGTSQTGERTLEYRSERYKGLELLDLKVLIERIVSADGPGIRAGGAERALQEILHDRVSRRRFIVLLLSLPEVETSAFIAGVSRVLRVDGQMISRFYMLRHEQLAAHEERKKERERLEESAGRYWKTLARLRHAISIETDRDKIDRLSAAYGRTRDIYARRRAMVAKTRKGMTQKEIADLLGLPRSTISNDICRMRELLHSIEA